MDMSSVVLTTANLTKIYQGTAALRDVSVSLSAGRIYGLIGQNGAGKTTLMRLIAGLAQPTSGSLELFGHSGSQALQRERKRLGSLIEHPAIVPYMTAKENLRLHRIMRGIPEQAKEDELLELTGLSDTGRKKAKHFSLGMKQRLGIAIALLASPELLILDEPVNGLDPLGIVDIRNLLKGLCEERQMSILISSHNLPELYQTATDYLIIHKGELKQTLTHQQLETNTRQHLRIGSGDPARLASMLETELKTSNFRVMPDQTVYLYDYLDQQDRVVRLLHEHGIMATELTRGGDTLEDYFIAVIGGRDHV